MTIVDVTAQGCWAEMSRTAYIAPGRCLCYQRQNGAEGWQKTKVADLRESERSFTLNRGEFPAEWVNGP
jgi:pyruvate kinase